MRSILLFTIIFNILLCAQSETDTSFSYIKLPNKTYTLNEVVEKSDQGLFSPLYEDRSKFGFTDDVFWIKVNSKNSSSVHKVQILELNYPTLDYIDIYELEDQQLVLKKELGDLRMYDKSTFMPNPSYEFTVLPEQEKVFFIKIISEGSLNIGVSVQGVNAYTRSSSAQIKWLTFYFGAVFIMLMYNFILYLIIKDRSFLYYVLFHISYITFALSLTGISFELFWPETPQVNQFVLPMSMAMTGAFGVLFAIYYLDIKNMSIGLYKFLYVLVFSSFLTFFLTLITDYSFAIQVGSTLSFSIAIALFIIALYLVFFKKNKNAIFYLLAWSFFVLGVVVAHLSNIGVIPSTMLTGFSSQIGSFFELLLLSIGLAYYYNRLKDEHMELTYTNDRLRELSHTDVLTGSHNRRYFYDRVNTLLSMAEDENSDFYLLMLDLDNFKNINDTYGHEAGDKVLISFTNTCKTMLREDDVFARFGGEEFVLFLPAVDEPTAVNIAKRINTAVRSTQFKDAPDLEVTVSIGISHSTFDLNELLKEADTALYRAKAAGRDTYVVF
ncbi:MAG: diguanylate cyclase [Campylobacterota bacterium]